ncbi:MAG: acyltransferase [Patescibacteria group bacterium]
MAGTASKPSYFNNHHKFSYLDGLRGTAALIVVFHHITLWFYPAMAIGLQANAHSPSEVGLYKLPINILWNGNFAVCIFFVLSGFVLSYKFLATGDANVLTSGAFRRYPRLVIPVIGSILIGYLCVKFNLLWNDERVLLTRTSIEIQQLWTQTGGLLAALGQGFFGIFTHQVQLPQQFNAVLWTMYFEFVGSFIVFGLLALFRSIKLRKFAYLFLAILLINTYFIAFIFGMILAELHTAKKDRLFTSKPRWGALALFIGFLLGTVPYPTVDVTSYLGLTSNLLLTVQTTQFMHIFGAALIIYGLVSTPAVQKLFSFRPALFLGRVSFSLYLLHTFVIAVFSKRFFVYLVESQGVSYKASFILTGLITVIASLAVAYVYTIYVDEKAIKLSRLLYQKATSS